MPHEWEDTCFQGVEPYVAGGVEHCVARGVEHCVAGGVEHCIAGRVEHCIAGRVDPCGGVANDSSGATGVALIGSHNATKIGRGLLRKLPVLLLEIGTASVDLFGVDAGGHSGVDAVNLFRAELMLKVSLVLLPGKIHGINS